MHFLPFKTWHHWSPARVSSPELDSFSCFFEVSPLTRVAAVDPAVSSVTLDSLCSYQWAFRLFPGFALPRGTVLILVRRALHIFMFGNCSALGFSGCTSCWKAASQNPGTSLCSRSYHGRGLLLPQPQRPIVLPDWLPFARFAVLIQQLAVISLARPLFSKPLLMLLTFSLCKFLGTSDPVDTSEFLLF